MLNQRLCGQSLQPNACSSRSSCKVLPTNTVLVVSRRRTSSQILCSAGGFGKSNKKKVSTAGGMVIPEDGKRVKKSFLADEDTRSSRDGTPPGFPTDWVDLKFKAGDFPLGKNVRPLELASGKTIMLYKFDNMLYISDANSTAYQYPMVDAKVFRDSSGAVAAEVPLDGTIYDLASGAVLKWCPKDNPMRNLLGTLKSAAEPTPLKVYPVHVTKEGDVWTKLL